MYGNVSCAARYEKLATERETFLSRGRECAKLTIPALLPDAGHSSSSILHTPYQGIGARGVNNLASKLLLSLLPPNTPFFRFVLDDFTATELAQQPGARAQIEEALNKIERSIQAEIESQNLRLIIFEALKQLIVVGNVLVYLPKDEGARVFDLRRYVVQRDPMGTPLNIIIKESVSPEVLDDKVREAVLQNMQDSDNSKTNTDKSIDVYTAMYRDGKRWRLHQEINETLVPGSEGSWPIDKSPMLPLRWERIDSEDYGRSYVEQYKGDMISLEGISKAILEATAASAKVVFMVNPNGTTRARDIADASNGAIVSGNADEVTVLQADKYNDMRVARETAQGIEQRMAFAFLMNTAVQRDGERVTAEEIRRMSQELDDALGGTFSLMSEEFQLPLVTRIMDRMTKQRRLPALPKGVVKPAIVTGLEALGRGHDLNKLDMFFQGLAQLPPEVLANYLNVGDYIKRRGTSLGIDMDGLVKSEEQIQQEQMAAQQAQQQQMQEQGMMDMANKAVGSGTGPAIKAAADIGQNMDPEMAQQMAQQIQEATGQ